MKRFVFTVIVLMFCMTTMAKVKITSGNCSFLQEKTTAIVVFDYSEASWEETETYEQWCGEDYAERVKLGYDAFILGFNSESSKLKIKKEDSLAKYRITIKISTMEQRPSGMWGRFYALCSGTITVEDIVSGEIVCTAEFKREDGTEDFVPNDRLAKCFNALGKATVRMR